MKEELSKIYKMNDLIFNFLNYAVSLDCCNLKHNHLLNAMYCANKYIDNNQNKICANSKYTQTNILANYTVASSGVRCSDASNALTYLANEGYLKVLEDDRGLSYLITSIKPKQAREYLKKLDVIENRINQILYEEYKKQLDLGKKHRILEI